MAGPATRLDALRERTLVERAVTDASAFAELYDFYLPRIFGFCLRRVADRSVAEDLTSITFERALGTLRGGSFRNESFGGWLYRVAGNATIDHLRRDGRTVPLPNEATLELTDRDEPGGSDTPRSDAWEPGDERALRPFSAALDRDALARAITGLPAAYRRVVVLRYVDGLEGDELAGALGCSRATAAVRVHRALRALRDRLERESTDAA